MLIYQRVDLYYAHPIALAQETPPRLGLVSSAFSTLGSGVHPWNPRGTAPGWRWQLHMNLTGNIYIHNNYMYIYIYIYNIYIQTLW